MAQCCHLQLSAAARQPSPAACSRQVLCPGLQSRRINSRQAAFGVGSKAGRSSQQCRVSVHTCVRRRNGKGRAISTGTLSRRL